MRVMRQCSMNPLLMLMLSPPLLLDLRLQG
jgi:hypothetical protein